MISPSMLSQRLKQLEEAGIVARRRASGTSRPAPGNVTYELTTSGQEVAQIMREMSAWGKRWAIAELRADDMEPSYMMWLAHRTIRTAPLGRSRVVINYEFHDAPAGRRRWWLVVEDGNVDLCFKHPGFAIDLTVSTRLRPMAELSVGPAIARPRDPIARRSVGRLPRARTQFRGLVPAQLRIRRRARPPGGGDAQGRGCPPRAPRPGGADRGPLSLLEPAAPPSGANLAPRTETSRSGNRPSADRSAWPTPTRALSGSGRCGSARPATRARQSSPIRTSGFGKAQLGLHGLEFLHVFR